MSYNSEMLGKNNSELTRVGAPNPVGPATTYPLPRGTQLMTEKNRF